jgi:hypothetical protein
VIFQVSFFFFPFLPSGDTVATLTKFVHLTEDDERVFPHYHYAFKTCNSITGENQSGWEYFEGLYGVLFG